MILLHSVLWVSRGVFCKGLLLPGTEGRNILKNPGSNGLVGFVSGKACLSLAGRLGVLAVRPSCACLSTSPCDLIPLSLGVASLLLSACFLQDFCYFSDH